MIIFEDNLNKYIEDSEWYNMQFLEWNLKGWNKHKKIYEKKNYKRTEKIAEAEKQVRLSQNQINKIKILMGLLQNSEN